MLKENHHGYAGAASSSEPSFMIRGGTFNSPFRFRGGEHNGHCKGKFQAVKRRAARWNCTSADNIIVAMQHTNRAGESKLLTNCSLPLTGVQCVKKIVTDLAVLEVDPDQGFVLLERAPGVTIDEIQSKTAGRLVAEGDIPEMQL